MSELSTCVMMRAASCAEPVTRCTVSAKVVSIRLRICIHEWTQRNMTNEECLKRNRHRIRHQNGNGNGNGNGNENERSSKQLEPGALPAARLRGAAGARVGRWLKRPRCAGADSRGARSRSARRPRATHEASPAHQRCAQSLVCCPGTGRSAPCQNSASKTDVQRTCTYSIHMYSICTPS